MLANWAALGYGHTLQHITPRIIEQTTLFARCFTILKIMTVLHVWRITLIMKWRTAQREVQVISLIRSGKLFNAQSLSFIFLQEEERKKVVFCRLLVLVAYYRFLCWSIFLLIISDPFISKHLFQFLTYSIRSILFLFILGLWKNGIYVDILWPTQSSARPKKARKAGPTDNVGQRPSSISRWPLALESRVVDPVMTGTP